MAIITNLPVPYRLALFRGLSERLQEVGAGLRVFFLASPPAERSWLVSSREFGFEHEFLRGLAIPARRRRPVAPLALGQRLRAYAPTMVVAAGFSPLVASRAARHAGRAGVPFGIWSGEIAATRSGASKLRRLQRARLLKRADFGIAYGSLAERFLLGLAADLPVVIGRNTSIASNGPVGTGAKNASRRTVELLTVGDLASDRKGTDILIDALALRPDIGCRLTVVGDGRKRAAFERRAAGDSRIRFVGGISGAELHTLYAASDIFLFPSRQDVFGLVLVEAMGAGLAAAVSASPGAVSDLAVPERNCLLVSTNEAREWAGAIGRLVEQPDLRERLGQAGTATVRRRWTIQHATDAMVAGLRLGLLAAAGPKGRAG
ncbi:MAG TPA: glycosyltransferase family 4 protein [Thermoleophilaceae bacterium]|nr:glycosyltransferase family 4 protein [Thermoleophilaceae bacterium]